MPTDNDGTLVSAAIRPLDDGMPIASAFAFEINGGHHQVETLVARNAIISQRRQWGMLCTVYKDVTAANNATYQLKYKYNNNSTNIMDNGNWVVFSGGAGGAAGGSSWLEPVLSVTMSTPFSLDGDRYLVGLNSAASLSGSFATLTNAGYVGNLVGGYIAEYKDVLSGWETTLPTDGMTLRVNDQDNSFYRYEGTYSTGQWYKERLNQVRHLSASSVNGVDYTITTGDFFTYSSEAVYLIQFGTSNSGSSATLNINGLGQKDMKKQDASGISDLLTNDLNNSNIYNLVYDGTKFRVNQPAVSGDGSAIKYRIVADERIAVPAYSEYLLYGDLEVNGILDISSTGKVVIINGALNVNGGTVSNSNRIEFVSIATDRNLQKIITYPTDFSSANYTITSADNGYSIIIVNGSAAVSITVPTGLTSKMQVGFIQDGTGDVTFATASTTINNAIGGYKIKGQYDQAYLEQGVNTSTYYLLGNTKI